VSWCLIKSESLKFKKALKDGSIDPVALSEMTSDDRHDFFRKYTNEDNATKINALFESKLLLKNKQAGYITWAKRVSNITQPAKRDILSRIESMDKILSPQEEDRFLRDLASTRLGLGVSPQEAKTIYDLSNEMVEARDKANVDGEFATKDQRLTYGSAVVTLENYINELKLDARKISFKEHPIEVVKKTIGELPGALKSMVASLDNSLWGRQGIKTLLDVRTSGIWFKNFSKSWGDIVKELRGKDAMFAIKADLYSRPNAINGKYKAGGYGLDVLSEEAFPSSLPARIPILGRLFTASESAYNGGALRLRADLADRYIARAEAHGVNVLDRNEAIPLGHLIGSMTGRGSIGKLEPLSKELNVLLFSIKFLKANLDTVTAHMFDTKVRENPYARKEAIKNTMSVVATIASLLVLAKFLDPDSVDEDPRSTNFGKIKIFGHWVDITGGMASLAVLASRLVPTQHNGDWGWWYKSSSGNYTKLGTNYGGMTALDVLENFIEGKLSPVAGIFRDIWKGKDFSGAPITAGGELQNISLPISIQAYQELMKDPGVSAIDMIGLMTLDLLGASVSTYLPGQFDWQNSDTKKINQFKDSVSTEDFKNANEEFNARYSQWLEGVIKTDEYKGLSDDAKSTVRTNGKNKIQEEVFQDYGFKYKTPRETPEDRQEDKTIKDLVNDKVSLLDKLDFSLVKKAFASDGIDEYNKLTWSKDKRTSWEKFLGEVQKLIPGFQGLENPIEGITRDQIDDKQLKEYFDTMQALRKKDIDWYYDNIGNEVEKRILGFDLGKEDDIRAYYGRKYDDAPMTDYENKTVETYDQYEIPREVIYGMIQAEGGRIGSNNVLNIGAYDSDPSKAINYDSQEKSATASAKLLSGTFRKESGKIDDRYKEAWENRDDPVKMIKLIEQSGFAGDPKTWKERSANSGGAGLTYDSWSEFVMDTEAWHKWYEVRRNK